jgi:hypothetical protein
MTFKETVLMCFDNKNLVKEFDRLNGSNLLQSGSPLELMVDDSCGRIKKDMHNFIEFVRDYIYMPDIGGA